VLNEDMHMSLLDEMSKNTDKELAKMKAKTEKIVAEKKSEE